MTTKCKVTTEEVAKYLIGRGDTHIDDIKAKFNVTTIKAQNIFTRIDENPNYRSEILKKGNRRYIRVYSDDEMMNSQKLWRLAYFGVAI